MMEHNDSEDELLFELDIQINSDLQANLNLLQYPLRPRYRPYGDQGSLQTAQLGLQPKFTQDNNSSAARTLIQEPVGIKMHHHLATTSSNYDKNAREHRITSQTLLATPVDTTGSAVDSTFASVKLNVQPNYAIGVFSD
jgi:hypothetical protein